MKYGLLGRFVKFAFAKTAFDYIGKEIPEIYGEDYKKRVLKRYREITERTPASARELNFVESPDAK